MADKKSNEPRRENGRIPTYQTAYHGAKKKDPLTNLARIIVEKFDKRRVPENTIDTIPFDQIYPDGLCRIGDNFYSKMVQFYDINYQLAQNDEKQHIFAEYCQFLNYFDETIHFQFCFINQRVDMEEYKKVISIPDQDDEFNVVRREYATYLRNQLEKGNNGIVKSKYLVFGIEARDRKQAVSRLAKIESDVINKFKLLGCKCVPVNGLERLRIMHDYLNQDSLEKFAMKSFKDVVESGLTPKNFITPTSFDFRAKDYYKIGDMFATTNFLVISAPEISDEMLADILNMEDALSVTRMKGDMENEERKHGQFNRGSEDDLCISGDSAGDRGTHEHSGGRNPGENERDGEHDASGEISVPEEDLRQVSGIVEEFRANTRDKFHELDGENSESIETMVRGHIEDAIETFGLDAKVVDVVLVGSRSRGIEHEESDVNVVVEFYGSEREDALSDILNEEGLSIAGKTIDINTITKDRTGTLETFLPEEEKYLAEKAAAMEQTAASKNMVADMSIEQAAEAELKSSDEKKRQHPDQKRGGKFANFSMQKKENSEKYNLYADVQYPSGEIDRHKCIAQFDNKSLAQRFCEKRGLQCEDVTGNLDSVIKHKKQLANQKGKISPDRNERKPGRGIGD